MAEDKKRITEDEALLEIEHGRAVEWDLDVEGYPKDPVDGPTDADIQAAGGLHQEHTENADLTNQADGTYADAHEAVEKAVDKLDDDADEEDKADAIEGALPDGVTEAELQDAQRRGMVEPAENPRNEAQQKLLKQEIENEGDDVTEEGLRQPENVEEEPVDEKTDADTGHEVPAAGDKPEDVKTKSTKAKAKKPAPKK